MDKSRTSADHLQLDLFASPSPPQPEKTNDRPPPDLEPSWLTVLQDEFDKPYMTHLRNALIEEKKQFTIHPPGNKIFNAFWSTPFNQVKVVILGQDPYHGPGQAHGLCFSVNPGVPPPPSLVNIFKEMTQDLSIPFPQHGCLTSWAKQGVFLLNTVLTVRSHQAQSHAGLGWENFTDRVISELNRQRQRLVFVLWGRPAQTKIPLIDNPSHLILKAPHPSPFSAYNGFFGCRHFSQINRFLTEHNIPPIEWALPPCDQ